MASVVMADGSTYSVKTLLAKGNSNAKLAKSEVGGKYLIYGLSLSPGNLSGYEVCGSRSPGCSDSCLFYAGQGAFAKVQAARIAKTRFFYQNRGAFILMLVEDMERAVRRANKQGKQLAVRLNVLSDLQWEKVFPDLFTVFKTVQFYDYTKHVVRMQHYVEGELPSNYHLTFSRSELNEGFCPSFLRQKANVAVVFDKSPLPAKWKGFTVVSGDDDDLRFLDKPGKVIGLYAKGRAKRDDTGFVVRRTPLTVVS